MLFGITSEPLSVTNHSRKVKGMRLVARVIGLGGSALFFTIMIGGAIIAVLSGEFEFTVWGTLLGVLGIIALAGCVISWWNEWLAGALLLILPSCLVIRAVVMGEHINILLWSVVLACLIAGMLFLLSWWLSRKASPPALSHPPT